jgi:hypothetical protein
MLAHPSARPPAIRAVLALALLVACNAPGPPSPSPSASPSADAECGRDEIAASGIDGSVVDGDGNPLGDIFVQLDNGAGFTGSARTPADGTFSAPGVSGEFVITTLDIDYESVTERVTVPCGETVDVELVLTPVDG